ncbi:uncharacterized protein LOC132791800 [Drosophila nasuta]|uniref:uncharacterized protein LOC132791800 n=1 Tax=Drosophila nasuta TaxID=42062 RepID=UPI00295EF3C1|nr:uncharacterized protein LOC132791800 [Drosophila nasuta]
MSENEDTTLHMELIEYATVSCRLLFIQDAATFTDFTPGNADNELSTMELCEILLRDILPKVHSYQLTEAVKKRLKLLDLHPGFRKTPEGYQYVSKSNERPFTLKLGRDFNSTDSLPRLLSAQPKRPKEFQLNTTDDSHTMLVDQHVVSFVMPKFQLSQDLAALLSAFISTDMELSCAQLHSVPEIQRRLRRAKQSFEDTANVLPLRKNLDMIVDYVIIFEKLKKKLCNVLSHA